MTEHTQPAGQVPKYYVLMVTTAYEQGVGKGHQAFERKMEISNPYGDEPCREAWSMGYEEGKEQAQRKAATEAPALIPAECDVRKILLAVVPGDDGMGLECYAENTDDVVSKMTELAQELEDWQLGIRRQPILAEWREAVRVAREALAQAKHNTTHGQIAANCRDAIAQLDALGGGE